MKFLIAIGMTIFIAPLLSLFHSKTPIEMFESIKGSNGKSTGILYEDIYFGFAISFVLVSLSNGGWLWTIISVLLIAVFGTMWFEKRKHATENKRLSEEDINIKLEELKTKKKKEEKEQKAIEEERKKKQEYLELIEQFTKAWLVGRWHFKQDKIKNGIFGLYSEFIGKGEYSTKISKNGIKLSLSYEIISDNTELPKYPSTHTEQEVEDFIKNFFKGIGVTSFKFISNIGISKFLFIDLMIDADKWDLNRIKALQEQDEIENQKEAHIEEIKEKLLKYWGTPTLYSGIFGDNSRYIKIDKYSWKTNEDNITLCAEFGFAKSRIKDLKWASTKSQEEVRDFIMNYFKEVGILNYEFKEPFFMETLLDVDDTYNKRDTIIIPIDIVVSAKE